MRELPQPKPVGFAGSLGEGASGVPASFVLYPVAFPPPLKPSPLGDRFPPHRGKCRIATKGGAGGAQRRMRGTGKQQLAVRPHQSRHCVSRQLPPTGGSLPVRLTLQFPVELRSVRFRQRLPPRESWHRAAMTERVRFEGISPIFSIDNCAKLAYITIVNTN